MNNLANGGFARMINVTLIGLAIAASPNARTDIGIDRDVLTVTTANLTAVFRGPDLWRLTNNLTKEQYLRPPIPFRSVFDFNLMEPISHPPSGDFWRKGRNEQAAQFIAHDLTRTVTINVIVDPETQDITLTMWGESLKEGATSLKWGIQGLDLTGGRLVMPVQGGRYIDEGTSFTSLDFPYPAAWEAQMVVWEDKLNSGGFVVYSRDDELRYKRLRLNKIGPRTDVFFETEAQAPWAKTGSVPAVEWRLNCYKGDWRIPATGYRNLMNFFRPPVPLKGNRAWIKDVRTVVSVTGKEPNPVLLDTLAKTLQPKRTLIFIPEWRKDGYDPNSDDYSPREGMRNFVERAHDLGYHVMLPIEPPGTNAQSSDYPLASKLLVRDAATGKHAVPMTASFANINAASKAYRDLIVARIKVMIDDVSPDVLYLPGAGTLPNDGTGLIERKSFSQGAVALHRALLTAFPDLLLAGEGMNEMISPFSTVTMRTATSSLPAHPISSLLFGNTSFPVSMLGTAETLTTEKMSAMEGQGIFPVISVSSAADITNPKPETAQFLKLAALWQERDMLPDWAGTVAGTMFRWRGADGSTITSEKKGDTVFLKLGKDVLFERSVKPVKTQAASTVISK